MKHFTRFMIVACICTVFFVGKFIGQNQLGIGVQPATGFPLPLQDARPCPVDFSCARYCLLLVNHHWL